MNNLKKLRLEKHLTQVALQIETGIDQSIISKYEIGIRTATAQNLNILADYFNTSVDYLLDRTDNPKPYPPRKLRRSQ